jgi:hypothetical protein
LFLFRLPAKARVAVPALLIAAASVVIGLAWIGWRPLENLQQQIAMAPAATTTGVESEREDSSAAPMDAAPQSEPAPSGSLDVAAGTLDDLAATPTPAPNSAEFDNAGAAPHQPMPDDSPAPAAAPAGPAAPAAPGIPSSRALSRPSATRSDSIAPTPDNENGSPVDKDLSKDKQDAAAGALALDAKKAKFGTDKAVRMRRDAPGEVESAPRVANLAAPSASESAGGARGGAGKPGGSAGKGQTAGSGGGRPAAQAFNMPREADELRKYADNRTAEGKLRENADAGQGAPASLYFNPQLITDERGEATIEFVMPAVESEYRLLIDAIAGGRIGSVQQVIRCQSDE